MKLPFNSESHLSYCTNIHPGETWPDVFQQLKRHLPELRRRLSPEKSLGIGLRVSADAAAELIQQDKLDEFSSWMTSESLYLFTINGFPYGNFHGSKVKDKVYMPDWQTEQRVSYTSDLVKILSQLLPEGVDGGISTSPLSYKYWESASASRERILLTCSENLARIAIQMADIFRVTGKELHLDIEPEPDCTLENSRETIDFFTNWLFKSGRDYLCKSHSISEDRAVEILRNHIRLCYDTCHFAVEYEDPESAIKAITEAGIRIGKTQISAALRYNLGSDRATREEAVRQLSPFDESTYLHQVVQKNRNGSITQFRDLGLALEEINNRDAEEWRIHFHVPVFVDKFEVGTTLFRSTQSDITESLQHLLALTDCRHFEIETYTWDVLPEKLKVDITDSIEREFRWVLKQFESINRSNSETPNQQ